MSLSSKGKKRTAGTKRIKEKLSRSTFCKTLNTQERFFFCLFLCSCKRLEEVLRAKKKNETFWKSKRDSKLQSAKRKEKREKKEGHTFALAKKKARRRRRRRRRMALPATRPKKHHSREEDDDEEEEEEGKEEKKSAVANAVPRAWLETTANETLRLMMMDTKETLSFLEMTCYASREEIEEESEREWMYALTERNMRKMYEQTWWWNSLEKRRELNHQCAKFVVVRMKEKGKDVAEPKAFAHFRFEVDDDDVASVYIYELQVEQTMKRSGLGKVLMQACERIGVGLGLKHMALTVLKTNEGARAFYAKIGYEETDHAPAGAHYVILRKRI